MSNFNAAFAPNVILNEISLRQFHDLEIVSYCFFMKLLNYSYLNFRRIVGEKNYSFRSRFFHDLEFDEKSITYKIR
ncbi:MAG: hypothetical protein LBB88_11735 [Planctomycetaceae bacterium]|nr:hypothetical protein [Planctomycetaceae bacterium]